MRIIVACILALGLYPILSKANKKPSYNPSMTIEIIRVTNLGEILLAKLAEEKSSNEEIDLFAEHIQLEHSQNLQRLQALMKSKNFGSQESDQSREIKMRNDAKHDQLDVLKGRSFDKAYIDATVSVHQDVLNSLNAELIPGALDAELRALLMKTRDGVKLHLQDAQRIQHSFSKE